MYEQAISMLKNTPAFIDGVKYVSVGVTYPITILEKKFNDLIEQIHGFKADIILYGHDELDYLLADFTDETLATLTEEQLKALEKGPLKLRPDEDYDNAYSLIMYLAGEKKPHGIDSQVYCVEEWGETCHIDFSYYVGEDENNG
jgi:hypothetical protein